MSSTKVCTRLPLQKPFTDPKLLRPRMICVRHGAFPRPQRMSSKQHQRSLTVQAQIPPAVLPGTTKTFPIKEAELVELAKKLSTAPVPIGLEDDSILAPDFKFEFPLVKLNKEKYLEAVKTFDIKGGVPNIANNTYDYRVDKYEPQRVWWTMRVSGTHTGTLKVFTSEFKPTGREIFGAPEAMSMTFNADGKVTSLTGGYVMDNRLGTCNRLGGLFGILSSMGVFVPFPQSGTLGWKVGSAVDTGVNFITKALHFFTFGVFKEKPKTA